MNKRILSLGLVGLLSGCATPEWKRACNEVYIDVKNVCYEDAENWKNKANVLGYNCRRATYFPKNKLPAHSIVELKQKDGTTVLIEPSTSWKTKLSKKETYNLCYDGVSVKGTVMIIWDDDKKEQLKDDKK